MLKLLEWFKLDKAALVQHMDVSVLKLKDTMRKKAERRQKFRKDVKCTKYFYHKPMLLIQSMNKAYVF